jgi:hypothetical protein
MAQEMANVVGAGEIMTTMKDGAEKVNDAAVKAINPEEWERQQALKKEPLIGEYQGLDLNQIQGYYDANQLDTSGYDAMKGLATRDPSTDPNSTWGKMMLEQQGLEEVAQRDRAASEGAGALAMARSNLAQRGGLTGAAAERMGASGMRDQMMRNQNVTRDGAMARSNINIQDEQNRIGAIDKLQGQANQIHQFDQQEAQAMANAYTQNVTGKNAWDLTKYGEDSKRWAAHELADGAKEADKNA